jgi:two-component system copper resistance phosphate regulon response regulator CusR
VTERGAVHELRVLVVEDEPGIRDFLSRGLANAGFLMTVAADGIAGEQLALSETFDAIVLDLMLPGRSGLEVLASVHRGKPNVPVLVLTARGRVADRVEALEAGAIDYLVKPFAMPELVARLRAQLRASARVSETVVSGAGIEADLVTRKVIRGARQITLSSTEFDLVLFLLRHRGRVVTRQQILSSVWGYQHDTATNNVDVYIGYLRKKLSLPESPAPIFTVRGVGYRLGDAG